MARSSGGGSRSGGSHSSGGHSSYSSHSHSHSGGSRSGGKLYICVKSPKAGCSKYSYIDRHGQTQYIWCNYNPAEKEKKSVFATIFLLICYIPFLFVAFLLILGSITIPRPLTKEENPYSSILIEDNIGVIENREELTQELSSFYEKTGVTPAIITVSHEKWIDCYNNLQLYAIDLYYQKFTDECHWLIVYSEPTTEEYNDWAWEGIIGDDTEKSISNSNCERLTKTLQNNLYRNNGVGTAITNAFAVVAENNKVEIDTPLLIMGCIPFLYIGYHIICLFGGFGKRKYYENAVLVEAPATTSAVPSEMVNEKKPTVVKCDYCGGTYRSDEMYACPHCGGPVNDNIITDGIYVKNSNSDKV